MKNSSLIKPVDLVEVFLWGKRVGVLFKDEQYQCFAFEFDPNWDKNNILVAPIAIQKQVGVHRFPLLPEDTYKKLPAFIADVLPDEFGNQVVNAWLSKQGLKPSQVSMLDRLTYLGNRGMGALEFRPSTANNKVIKNENIGVALSKIIETARQTIAGDLLDQTDKAIQQLINIGTSAGGQRAKAVIAFNKDTMKMHSPIGKLQNGFEHWMIKLDGVSPSSKNGFNEENVSSGYGNVEYAYYLMAKEAGINISESFLLKENGRAHFMTKRFDRDGDKKVHMQTLCAMNHMNYKQVETHAYEQYFDTIEALGMSSIDKEEAFRRMVFNIKGKNCDDHTKNFSFLLRQGENSWQLAPAYDLCFAYSPTSYWVSKHLMSVNGKFTDIQDVDLLCVAKQYGISNADKILSQVKSAISKFNEFAIQAEVPQNLIEEISKEILDKKRILKRKVNL